MEASVHATSLTGSSIVQIITVFIPWFDLFEPTAWSSDFDPVKGLPVNMVNI